MQEIDNKKPKVSVITVCLNSAGFLEEAIKSLSEQTYPNIEYIVMDGGSTDGSIDILNRYQDRISEIVIEKDSGIFNAMNKGIGLASGDIVYFLNSDDKFYDNKVIETAVGAFINNKEVDFIYGNLMVFDPVANASYVERYPEKISKSLFLKKTIGHPASFFRFYCFDKAGYFDERYTIAADYEWYLRAVFKKGLKGIHIDKTISVFRLGGNSTEEKNMRSYFVERNLIQKKYFNPMELLYVKILFIIKRLLGKRVKIFLRGLRYG